MPDQVGGHNIPCILDTEYGLWCGVEDINNPILVYLSSTYSYINSCFFSFTSTRVWLKSPQPCYAVSTRASSMMSSSVTEYTLKESTA